MKLIFNPFYDQPLYTGNKEGCSLGEKYVGPFGLLNELELRAGLSRLYPGQATRVIGYCEALSRCAEAASCPDDLFYWKSFCVDMLNVSRRLLEWRDALVYAGMKDLESVPDGISDGAGNILSDIRHVEEYFNDCSSTGDRWACLAQESGYLSSDWTIEVRMKEELVDQVIINCLKKSGATCRFLSDLPEIGHVVTASKFSNLIDGYQWALTQEELQDSVYVNKDNVCLNGVLTSLGKAAVGSDVTGVYTPISQLFSSGMRLFMNPVDYDSLVSYLAVPVHPLNDYVVSEDKTLRCSLYSHLLSQGGFGENERSGVDWKDIVAQAKPVDGCRCLLPLDCCLDQWNKGTTLSAVKAYCSAWSEWCTKKAAVVSDSIIAQQLLTVKESFDLLPHFLRLTGKDSFSDKELTVNIASAAASCSYTADVALAGSLDVVSDIKAIAAPCERAIWMDCYEQGMSGYQYSFLNESDIRLLNDSGMMIPLYDTRLQAESVTTQLAYSYVTGELVILTPEKVENRKCYPLQIPGWDGKCTDKTTWTPKGRELDVVEVNTQKVIHRVPSSIFEELDKTKDNGGLKRNKESFSSLDMLIQNPFDYVFSYLFNCTESGGTNLSQVKGNVVHKMFNNAVINADCDWLKVKAALTDNFDENFETAVYDVGIELLSLDNRLTYRLFKEVVRDTGIPVFIKIVEENQLEIVGSELDINVDLNEIGKFNAKIDMVLRNPQGKYVIMDFKWTENREADREEEIRNNMEMQLALYAQAVIQHLGNGKAESVEAIGYFMLKQGEFYTEYPGLKENPEVKVINKKNTDPIFEMVKKSYKFRMQQLKGESGEAVIEEGEQMDVPDGIEGYHDAGGRFPLKDIAPKSRGAGYRGKKESTFGRNVVLKGMLK